MGQRQLTKSGHLRAVNEHAISGIQIKGISFVGEVCRQQIKRCVAIHVTKGCPHTGFGCAFSIERHAAQMTLVTKGAIGTVDPKTVRIQIIGNIDIGPSVTIKVG